MRSLFSFASFFAVLLFVLPSEVAAQSDPANPAKGAREACEGMLLAAGVGTSGTSYLWLNDTRDFNMKIATPETTLKLGPADVKIPAFTFFEQGQTANRVGSLYQPSTRTTTAGLKPLFSFTWSDHAEPLRGVCVSYDAAIQRFLGR